MSYKFVNITFDTNPISSFRLAMPMTAAKQEQGFIGLPAPGRREGMLFKADGPWGTVDSITLWKAPYNFDMVWLGKDGRVSAIEKNVNQRQTKTHRGVAAIEMLAGMTSDAGIRVGTAYVITSGDC